MMRQVTILTDQLGSIGSVSATSACSIDPAILDIFPEGLGSTELGAVLAALVEECFDGVLLALSPE